MTTVCGSLNYKTHNTQESFMSELKAVCLCVPASVCLRSMSHKMINNIAEGRASRKCVSMTGMKRHEQIECAMEKPLTAPTTPPYPNSFPVFSPCSALFSRIIDGACEVQRTGMKMSQSLGCKTRAKAKGGAEGGGTTTQHAVFIAVFNTRGE